VIRNAKDLSIDQKAAIESLLGRRVLENEAISVRTIDSPRLSDDRRLEVLRGLEAYFAQVDAQLQPASPEEAAAIMDEALRSTRRRFAPCSRSVLLAAESRLNAGPHRLPIRI